MTSQSLHPPHDSIEVRIDSDLEELIPGFLESRRLETRAIDAMLRRDDYVSIRRLGHNLRGAGAGYGFDALTQIGEQIEQAALDRDVERVVYWNAQLGAYLERVHVVYE